MNIKPTREQHSGHLVADLDALIDDSIPFKLHGHNHEITSISTLEFFKFAERLATINSLRDKENLTPNEIIEAYFELISSVCPTITLEDIEYCTSAQLGALFQLVLDKVMGRMTEGKKKALIEDPSPLLLK